MADVSQPCVWTDVPAEAVLFKTAVRQNNGGVRVDMELDRERLRAGAGRGTQRIRVQTPRFRRFKIKEWKDRNTGRVSYSGSFSVGDLQGIGAPARFVQEWVRPLEERIVQTAADKSIEWFKKAKTREDLDKAFTSGVNEGGVSNEGRPYGPLMKCKVPFLRGRFECEFYKGDRADPDKMKGSPSSMAEYLEATDHGAEGVDCVAILEYESVWFMNKDFGVTPVLKMLLYWPRDKLTGFSFQADPTSGTAAIEGGEAAGSGDKRGPADAFLDGPVAPAKRAKPSPPAEEDAA